MKKTEQKSQAGKRLYISILLALLAFVAVVAATVAWFSIADRAKVKTMSLEIVADADLRMDLDPHKSIEQYVKTLSFEQIANRIQKEKGFSMKTIPLEPVTTSDQKVFTYEDGRTVADTSGAYLEFTLHFMAEKDLIIHLTSADSSAGAADGTAVMSGNSALPPSMRISFTADGNTWIYDPGMEAGSNRESNAKTFGLPGANAMKINNDNAMFSLKEGVDKAVEVHIWMEGTDPACTDELRGSDYSIRLRFTGEKTDDQK